MKIIAYLESPATVVIFYPLHGLVGREKEGFEAGGEAARLKPFSIPPPRAAQRQWGGGGGEASR
jgi:hypothetical protein